MSSDQRPTKTPEENLKEGKEEMANIEPDNEVSESDVKIARKRAKKTGLPEDVALHARWVQKNTEKAGELFQEFQYRLALLGHVIEGKLSFTDAGITPKISFRPLLDKGEMQTIQSRLEVLRLKKKHEGQDNKVDHLKSENNAKN